MSERERLDRDMAGAVTQCVRLQHEASAAGDEQTAWFLGRLRVDLFTAWQHGLAAADEQEARAAEVTRP